MASLTCRFQFAMWRRCGMFHKSLANFGTTRCSSVVSTMDLSPFAQVDASEYVVSKELIAATPSPALFVFMDAVRHNVHKMIQVHCGGDASRWRPHLKTTKMAPIFSALLEAGVRRFKCATPKEAHVFLSTVRKSGVNDADLLVSYPHVEPNLSVLAALACEFPETRLSVLVEDTEGVADVSGRLGMFIDVNVGQDRTGIPIMDQEQIMQTVAAAARTGQLRGLHFYDGHNTNPAEEKRSEIANACYERAVATTADALEVAIAEAASGHAGEQIESAIPEVVTSGSTTFLNALAFDWTPVLKSGSVHTVSPGTIVFHDARYDSGVQGLGMKPAALVLSRVISRPNNGMVTLDAGSKGLAAEAGHPVAKVLGRCNGEGALDALIPSEEHLPMRFRHYGSHISDDMLLARGSALWLFPLHICPTVNMYDKAVLIESGREPITVPVDARGH